MPSAKSRVDARHDYADAYAQTPEAGLVQCSYNNDGTLLSKTDALARKSAYTYDALAYIKEVTYSPANSAPDPCQQVNYSYDYYPGGGPFNSGYPSANSAIGRLTSSAWGGASTGCPYGFLEEYAYDAQGKVFARGLQITDTGYPAATPLVLTSYFSYAARRCSILTIS